MLDLIHLEHADLVKRAARLENDNAILAGQIRDLHRRLDCLQAAQLRNADPNLEWEHAKHPDLVRAVAKNWIGIFTIQTSLRDEIKALMPNADEVVRDDAMSDLLREVSKMVQTRTEYDKHNRQTVHTMRIVVGVLQ